MNEPLDSAIWDKLLVFALPDDTYLSRREVRASLSRLDIDTKPAKVRVHRALKSSCSLIAGINSDGEDIAGLATSDDVRYIGLQCAQVDKLLNDATAASSYAVVGVSLAGLIVSWTARAEEMYGYSMAEANGRMIDLLSPPDGLADLQVVKTKICHGESITPIKTVQMRKDGRRFTTSVGFYPVKNAAGLEVGSLTVAGFIGGLQGTRGS